MSTVSYFYSATMGGHFSAQMVPVLSCKEAHIKCDSKTHKSGNTLIGTTNMFCRKSNMMRKEIGCTLVNSI